MVPNSPEYEKALDEFIQLRRRTFYPKTDSPLDSEGIAKALAGKREIGIANESKICSVAERLIGRSPDRAEFRQRGTFHVLYRIHFPDEDYCYLRGEAVFRQRPAFEFLIEELLPKLAPTKSVEIVATDWTRAVLPFDFQVLRRASGRCVTELENPDTQFLPDALLEDWGRTLARLHQIKATGAGLLNPRSLAHGRIEGVLPNWNEYLLLNLDHHLDLCLESGALTTENSRAISNTFINGTARLHATPIRLLHGDPGHHNIFAEADKISAIIDWEDALAGDPIFDVAYWGTFVRDYLREPFLRGYREIAPLPADFEFRYWLYYLRIAISKTAHRHLFGYKDHPGRPPASARITKALSHLASLERTE